MKLTDTVIYGLLIPTHQPTKSTVVMQSSIGTSYLKFKLIDASGINVLTANSVLLTTKHYSYLNGTGTTQDVSYGFTTADNSSDGYILAMYPVYFNGTLPDTSKYCDRVITYQIYVVGVGICEYTIVFDNTVNTVDTATSYLAA